MLYKPQMLAVLVYFNRSSHVRIFVTPRTIAHQAPNVIYNDLEPMLKKIEEITKITC